MSSYNGIDGCEIRRMRDCIIRIYGDTIRNRKVNDMHPSQVIAIYNRLKKNNFEKGGRKKEQKIETQDLTKRKVKTYHQYNIFEFMDAKKECEKKYPYIYNPETKIGVIGLFSMDFRNEEDYSRMLNQYRDKYYTETF